MPKTRPHIARRRVERLQTGTHLHGRRLPVEPFRVWIEELIERERKTMSDQTGVIDAPLGPVARVSCSLGVTERQLNRWRHQGKYVTEPAADAALCHEGTLHLGDLWPDIYWSDEEEE